MTEHLAARTKVKTQQVSLMYYKDVRKYFWYFQSVCPVQLVFWVAPSYFRPCNCCLSQWHL